MKNELNVLVLGVGGNISQGILKALSISSLSCRVIGACITPFAAGLYIVDKAYISPLANSPVFIEWLIKICRKEKIQAVLSGVEPVLEVLAEHASEIKRQSGAVCIVSNLDKLLLANDKLKTCEWLKLQNFNCPKYTLSNNKDALAKLVNECGYPLIAKIRKGRSTQGVFKVENSTDLNYFARKKDYLIQEYLNEANLEFTVGCFSDKDGRVMGAIAMRRELLQGTTWRAEVGDFIEVKSEAIRIVEALKPMGPCNIQLRVVGGRPICFEINERFSGTTPLRARLGFNDVEATLRHYVLGEPAQKLPLITHGIVLRYWNEMYIDNMAIDLLKREGFLDNMGQYDVFLEDHGIKK